jgi:hypothetical protein
MLWPRAAYYDALLEAGASEETAHKTAEAIAYFATRVHPLEIGIRPIEDSFALGFAIRVFLMLELW